ncbi:hypothetical protein ACN27F_00865 [Solwaraspora sp. WMMB335]|uniref:hypothetical protein n=1 Tax=Solwaraspora sp. WMMB335 TaxID=3404118 RepID=UPI003B93B1BF
MTAPQPFDGQPGLRPARRTRRAVSSLLLAAVALAVLGAAAGWLVATTHRATGLAYANALALCPAGSTGYAACLTRATRPVGLLMLSAAAGTLGAGLGTALLVGLWQRTRLAATRPAHPLLQARFVELCRQHRCDGPRRPRLRVGGQRATSVRVPGRPATVVVPAVVAAQPVAPARFDPLVRTQLDLLGTSHAGWPPMDGGWPRLVMPCAAGLVLVIACGRTTIGVSWFDAVRFLLLAAVVAGLALRLPGPGRHPPRPSVAGAWLAGSAAGAVAGAGALTVAAVAWHVAPSADPRLWVGVSAVCAALTLAGLPTPLTPGGRDARRHWHRVSAVAGTLAGLAAGAAVFPATGLPARIPPVAPGTTHGQAAGPAPTPARSATPPQDRPGPVTSAVGTAAANLAARSVEVVLGPRWQADPLPAPPPAGQRPASCHRSIIDAYLRSMRPHRIGHGVARYAAVTSPGGVGLSRLTLQIDIVSYGEPVELFFAATRRAASACRELTDTPSGLRVQALTRPAPEAGERAWRVDLISTLGSGASRVSATTALAVSQVGTTLVLVTMTASLTALDGDVFDEALRRTVAALSPPP